MAGVSFNRSQNVENAEFKNSGQTDAATNTCTAVVRYQPEQFAVIPYLPDQLAIVPYTAPVLPCLPVANPMADARLMPPTVVQRSQNIPSVNSFHQGWITFSTILPRGTDFPSWILAEDDLFDLSTRYTYRTDQIQHQVQHTFRTNEDEKAFHAVFESSCSDGVLGQLKQQYFTAEDSIEKHTIRTAILARLAKIKESEPEVKRTNRPSAYLSCGMFRERKDTPRVEPAAARRLTAQEEGRYQRQAAPVVPEEFHPLGRSVFSQWNYPTGTGRAGWRRNSIYGIAVGLGDNFPSLEEILEMPYMGTSPKFTNRS